MMYRLLADALLLVHLAVIFCVVGGLVWIWVGRWRRWRAVRSFGLRAAHLLLMALVAGQAWLGRFCPLTVWEARLRMRAGLNGRYTAESFVAYWVSRLIYVDVDLRTLAIIYTVFFVAVVATWFLVRPAPRGPRTAGRSSSTAGTCRRCWWR